MKITLLGAGDYVTIVDYDVYEWAFEKRFLSAVVRGGKCYARWKGRPLHRVIMRADPAFPFALMVLRDPPAPGLFVDHRNGNSLDNRRENLRWATPLQNCINRGPFGSRRFKGVRLVRPGEWEAYITVNGKKQRKGVFTTAEEAAWWHDRMAKATFGEYAWLNYPQEALKGESKPKRLSRPKVVTPDPTDQRPYETLTEDEKWERWCRANQHREWVPRADKFKPP